MADIRTRNYACIIYFDSVVENYIEILDSWHIPYLLSPIHDKDFNPTGERKKPHRHLLLLFDSVKTTRQAKDYINQINGVGLEIIGSLRGYARYLCHLDNPEKAQYNPKNVISSCGLDYSNICTLTMDRYKSIQEMIEFCTSNKIYSFAKLSIFASQNNFDWFKILCDSGAVFMKSFLQSLFFDSQNEDRKSVVILTEENINLPNN